MPNALALLLATMLTMTTAIAPRVVTVKLGPAQRQVFDAVVTPTTRFVEVEGAVRSAKTWSILFGIRRVLEQHPGIRWTISRWNESGLRRLLIPDYRNVCALMEIPHGEWNSREQAFDLPNGSRLYAIHLKAQESQNRFAHVRGLTTAGLFVNQLEELPEDVYEEAELRLSQPGYPQVLIADANPVPKEHWIAKHKFPENQSNPDHRYLRLSIWDNAHNLGPETIAAAERLYPIGHPKRRTKIEGKRGLEVTGTPVYLRAFTRERHVRALSLLPNLPLGEAYDYGFHHPCVVWYQYAPWGWVRVLGGVMGTDLHLDAFLPIVERVRREWFPTRLRIDACCDPAGAAENSQGLRGTPVSILRDWYREHGQRDERGQVVTPRFSKDANHPERRHTANELLATYMRRQVNGDEAFLVDPERWLVAECRPGETEVTERFEDYVVEALESGYVLEDTPRHSERLGSFFVPKKDGWFEHPMNCLEYAAQADVRDLPLATERADQAKVRHDARLEREKLRQLREAQRDTDPDDRQGRRVQRVALIQRRGRGGYR